MMYSATTMHIRSTLLTVMTTSFIFLLSKPNFRSITPKASICKGVLFL